MIFSKLITKSATRFLSILLVSVMVIGIVGGGLLFSDQTTTADTLVIKAVNADKAPYINGQLTQVSAGKAIADATPKRNIEDTLARHNDGGNGSVARQPHNYEEGFVFSAEIPLSMELQKHTYVEAMKNELEYTMVLALMWRESRFDHLAVGYNTNGTTDHGIMQINDSNRGWLSRDLGINNLMDPSENIRAGTSLLGDLASKHGEYFGLMAYQLGEQGMLNKVSVGITTNRQVDVLYAKSAEFRDLLVRSNNAPEII